MFLQRNLLIEATAIKLSTNSHEDTVIHSRHCSVVVIMSTFFVSGRKILWQAFFLFWENFLQTALEAGSFVGRHLNIKPREHTVCSLT